MRTFLVITARTIAFVNASIGFVYCYRREYTKGTAFIATACYFMLAGEAFV